MQVQALQTRLVKANDDLLQVIDESIAADTKLQAHLPENSVLAISSKIISYCQGRLVKKTQSEIQGFSKEQARAEKHALVQKEAEHYLGYFTRFGDAASDIEPLVHLYKTEVRQLAQELALPEIFLQKAPSAGLWENQSDEAEFGFSYELADQVLTYLIDRHLSQKEILELFPEVEQQMVQKVLTRVEQMAFKQEVPYKL